MSDLFSRLDRLRPRLIRCTLAALSPDLGLQASVETEVARFYDHFIRAAEADAAEELHGLMADWVASQPASTAGEHATLIPLLHTLRECTWRLLQDELPPADALAALVPLDRLFAGAVLALSEKEYAARVEEIVHELGVAREQMAQLDRSKSDFIAVAAHELKTPLTLIEGYTQLLGGEFGNSGQSRTSVLLRGLGNGTRRLREIIDDMIDVSMIDNDLVALDYELVSLRVLFDRARFELEKALQDRQLSLTLAPSAATVQTYADPVRLYQVFWNILENAVKFTPDGGHITVDSRLLPGFVEVTIADTGIGIALENQQRIFEKFGSLGDATLHSSGKTKFKGGGPGLGLPIARGLITAHGGTVWVESPGYDEESCPGSTFHIMLPLHDAPPEKKEPQLLTWAKDPRPWRQLGKRG